MLVFYIKVSIRNLCFGITTTRVLHEIIARYSHRTKNRVGKMASIRLIVLAEWDTCLFRRLAHCYNNWLLSFVLSEKKKKGLTKVCRCAQLSIYIESRCEVLFFFRHETQNRSYLVYISRFAITSRVTRITGDSPNKRCVLMYRSIIYRVPINRALPKSVFNFCRLNNLKRNFALKIRRVISALMRIEKILRSDYPAQNIERTLLRRCNVEC